MSIVYLNGEFLPSEQACVPVLDRGFLFGDGIYEVIPVYGGHLFRLNEHLFRLQHSLNAIRLTNPLDDVTWRHCLQELIVRNGGGDLSVYLQITRGVAPRDHAFPQGIKPTLYAHTSPLKPLPNDLAERGVPAVTLEDIRWQRCDIKAITLLANVLLRQQAVDQGATEAILIRNGMATEGTASNLFIVLDGMLITPPKGPFLLPGITRDLVLELATMHHMAYREAIISPTQLNVAEEIWLTSSTRELLPVTLLNGLTVSNGRPGPLWHRMIRLYQDYKQRVREGHAV